MIESTAIKKQLEEERVFLRSSTHQLTNVITDGTNCSPFEAEIIANKAQEVFHLGDFAHINRPQAGQLIWKAIDSTHPHGVPLNRAIYKEVVLTFCNFEEDREIHKKYSMTQRRQQQILRMASEAVDQGTYLTQEDLSLIIGSDIKTIRCDIKHLQKANDILVPTRGNKLDIGPGVTHREKAVEKYIQGKNPAEISRDMKHSIKAIERYTRTFCRSVYCQKEVHDTLKTAMIVGISLPLLNKYLDLHQRFLKDSQYAPRLKEIEEMGSKFWDTEIAKKKPILIDQKGMK